MSKKLFGLGKGLGSLIPRAQSDGTSAANARESVFYIEVSKIRPNPDQPRREFDDAALGELAASIRKFGVLQPLLVTKREEESARGRNVYYELIAGERRWRASQKAGLPQVPVIIRQDTDKDSSQRLEMALIENVQRENLNPMEAALAYQRLQDEFNLSLSEIGTKVSKSVPYVANTIRLLKLPKYIQEALRNDKISFAHGRALLAFDDSNKQKQVYDQILNGGFSSKDVEAAASNSKSKPVRRRDARYADLEQNLTKRLAVPVSIRTNPNKTGSIMIRFANHEELNTVIKRIVD